jgi:hypothetical protein
LIACRAANVIHQPPPGLKGLSSKLVDDLT